MSFKKQLVEFCKEFLTNLMILIRAFIYIRLFFIFCDLVLREQQRLILLSFDGQTSARD